MSSAGYGNHQDSRPGDASNKPAAGGGEKPAPAPDPANAEGVPTPPRSGEGNALATPGDGAGPSGPQGGEVDPGAG